MILKVYPENPAPRHISMIVDKLREGGIIIYPTDTIYAIGCDMNNKKAIDKLCKIINKKPEEANLSLICYDLSNLSEYTVPFENRVYKLMRKYLPGPFTFILKSNNKVPKMFKNKKKTIGIRVPDNSIPREIVKILGNPLVTASLHDDDNVVKYFTDPEEIFDKFKDKVDIVIDGGVGSNIGSTVLDCSGQDIDVLRDSRGLMEELL